MTRAHSILSPSGSIRWLLCEGSLWAAKDLPEAPAGKDAALGTAKHHYGEVCLKDDKNAVDFLGDTLEVEGFKFKVTTDFAHQVQSYVDGVRRTGGELYVETWLESEPVLGVPGQGGTADAMSVLYEPSIDAYTVDVQDAKFGYHEVMAGEGVEYAPGRTGNPQGLIYLASAVKHFELAYPMVGGKFTIHQPSRDHHDTQYFSPEDLELFQQWAAPRAQRAYRMYRGELAPTFSPGTKQCKWCPVRANCAAKAEYELAQYAPAEKKPSKLTDEDIAKLLAATDGMIEWAGEIQKEAKRRALNGHTLPGFKLITGKRGARFWKDAKAAEVALGGYAYEDPVLISPTKAEEVLGSERYVELVKKFVDQAPAGPQLVPASKKGTPYVPSATSDPSSFPVDSKPQSEELV